MNQKVEFFQRKRLSFQISPQAVSNSAEFYVSATAINVENLLLSICSPFLSMTTLSKKKNIQVKGNELSC